MFQHDEPVWWAQLVIQADAILCQVVAGTYWRAAADRPGSLVRVGPVLRYCPDRELFGSAAAAHADLAGRAERLCAEIRDRVARAKP